MEQEKRPQLGEHIEEVKDEPKSSQTGGPEEERKLVRRLDRRIFPITDLLYLLAYLDRSNLGTSRLQGLPKDTLGGDPTGRPYDWINSIFFFAYVLCQVPCTITSKLIPPSIWLACMAIGWGLSSTLMSTAVNFGGLATAPTSLCTYNYQQYFVRSSFWPPRCPSLLSSLCLQPFLDPVK
ncbi:hypothetical protein C8R43DRAFT_981719 [Mycena crocata]|nr:hypothetical protein C8R43DRAFT_981719 [Mycena crocata]